MSQESRRSPIFLGEAQIPLFNRLTARIIDVLVLIALYFLFQALLPPVGIVCAATIAAIQDAMWAGQSIGKRIMGLKVIEDHRGLPCSYRNSFLRNIPFVVGVLLLSIPMLWVFFVLVGLPLLALELYLVFSLETGVRLGDVIGNTVVVEYLDDSLRVFEAE